MDANTARDLRTAYLHTFDSFATDPVKLADQPGIGNPRYARELLATLVSVGLVVQDQVNGGEDVWQAAETYDSISRDEAVKVIDTWLESQGVEVESSTPATKAAASQAKRSTERKAKVDSNPADLPLCKCGCGAAVGRKSNYKPGHDARHAGDVARQIADSGKFDALADLPSQALQDKASAMAERLIEKAVAKTEPKVTHIITDPTPPAEVKPEAKPAPRKSAPKKSKAQRNAESNAKSVASLLP